MKLSEHKARRFLPSEGEVALALAHEAVTTKRAISFVFFNFLSRQFGTIRIKGIKPEASKNIFTRVWAYNWHPISAKSFTPPVQIFKSESVEIKLIF